MATAPGLLDPELAEKLRKLSPDYAAYVLHRIDWLSRARAEQVPPSPEEQAQWLTRMNLGYAQDNLKARTPDPAEPWTEFGAQAGRGFGKLLCVDTPIPTPAGWRRLGDMAVGDEVFDEAGRVCRIVKTFDGMPDKAYRLHFSDGTSVDACAEHQWVTWTHRDRKQYLRNGGAGDFPSEWPTYRQPVYHSKIGVVGYCGPEVRTTQDIIDTFTHSTRGDTNHCIPTCGDLQYPERRLPLHPWLLGYWLGNGSTRDARLSCHQDDADVAAFLFAQIGNHECVPVRQHPERDFRAKGLRAPLRLIGVLGNKHVPRAYLEASPLQRRLLLAGLLDSDGHCNPKNTCIEFCSTSRALADAVVELARSLGQKPVLAEGRAKLNGKDYGPKYRVTWRSTYQPFVLARKAAAWSPPGAQALRNRHRMIVRYEEIAPKPMRCLTVDGRNSMFLCGEGMIPTHNTRMGAEWLLQAAWEDPQAMPRCIVAPTQQDVRMTCFEGESGLLNIVPPECVSNYNRTELVLTLTNGAMLRGFSAEKADRLRGPQHADAWCFAGGTPVLMADGSEKPIKDVAVGDMVMTRHGPRRVVASGLSQNPAPRNTVYFNNGRWLTGTIDHPILTSCGWRPIGALRRGNKVVAGAMRDGVFKPCAEPVRVERTCAAQQPLPVYNLTVEGEHEFIAGGIVVHNCDELAGWGPDGEDVFDMLMFGMRLGARPRIVWTSTPKPNALIRRLTAPKAGRIIVRGSTFDNRANLPDSFFKQLEAYDGTKLGRQELYGELLDPEEAGIIRRSWLRLWPADKPLPSFQWIIMSLDTAFTERTLDKKGDADPTACGVFGVFMHEKRTNVMLLDCWEDHLGLPELTRRVRKEMNNRYGDDEDDAVIKPLVGSPKPIGSGRKPDILLIEDKGSGISLRQTLAEQGIEAYAYNPGRADKLSRLHIVSPIFAQRRVWLPESNKMPGKPRNWCEPLIAQLCSFTGEGSVKHDDYVDVCTQALRLMTDKGMLSLVKPPEERRDYTPPPPPDYSNPYDV